ncbi:MAG: cytochrome c oxidase subunit II [Paracoccaceae bacterium]
MATSLNRDKNRQAGFWLALSGITVLNACGGRQSVLNPAGRDAETLAQLFWVMLAGAVLLWLLVAALFIFATRIRTDRIINRPWAETLIIVGGIVFPVVLLGALLIYSLPLMSNQRGPGDGLIVQVTGEQWWWRVTYLTPDGPVTSANEIRLPVGRRSEFVLNADNVIHSLWIPALGGKIDMIPGRETRMTLEPLTAGTYRGQCAEFCGASHALMAFEVVVMTPEDFSAWLAKEAEPASASKSEGAAIFAREGCGACHTIRGTDAAGMVGPDLTHVGGRVSLGAGIMGVEADDFADWIGHTETIKPEVRMPSYDHLDMHELTALGRYLESLT